MKKLFRALSLCLTLALCVSGSTAALAEAPAATPAPQDERVITCLLYTSDAADE